MNALYVAWGCLALMGFVALLVMRSAELRASRRRELRVRWVFGADESRKS